MTNIFPTATLLLVMSAFSLSGQSINNTQAWTSGTFDQNVFIENKGQFASQAASPGVLYAADWGQAKILFTKSGLIYQFTRFENNKELLCKPKEFKTPGTLREITVVWKDANPGAELIAQEKVTGYYLHPLADGRPEAYKRLLYRNIYPNIDAEYVFHPQGGLKYSFLVHPGASVSDIQMLYTGAEGIFTDNSGNLHVKNHINETIEYAPVSFYRDNSPIPSSFAVNGNIVTLQLPSLDPSREAVIDPWVNNPMFATSNKAFDVEVDKNGNVYVYGSNKDFKLQKYNSAGILQWNFNSGFNSSWIGDLAVDSSGNSYISSGDGLIKKVSPAGVIEFSAVYLIPVIGLEEVFLLCFSKTLPQVKLLSGHGPGEATVYYKEIIAGREVAAGILKAPKNDELRAVCASTNGSYYTVSETANFDGSPSDSRLIRFDNLLMPVFSIPSGYTGNSFGYFGTRYKPGSSPTSTNGSQNGLAASGCFVYSYDGKTLIKRDAFTGAMIRTIDVQAGMNGVNSGIYADECDQVYVGTRTGVNAYNSNLDLVNSAATPGAVYDVKYNYVSNEILACGDGFVTSLNIAAGCTPVAGCAAAVPINLVTFSAKAESKDAVLSWQAISETDNINFEVQRSADATRFETIGTVTALAGSGSMHSYGYRDINPLENDHTGSSGRFYYRLKENSADEKIYYSPIREVRFTGLSASLRSWPNPVEAGEAFSVQYSSDIREELQIRIINAMGNTVGMSSRYVSEGLNTISVPTTGLPAGVYYLYVSTSLSSLPVKMLVR